jgi:hypothetical protein
MWESSLSSKAGITFDEYLEDIADHIFQHNYDRIILTRFEDHKAEPEVYWGLTNYISQVETYDYGWSLDMLEVADLDELEPVGELYKSEHGQLWCEGGNHSEIVWVADWMLELQNDEVSICGAFDGECIEDLQIALEAAKVKFDRVESLIV